MNLKKTFFLVSALILTNIALANSEIDPQMMMYSDIQEYQSKSYKGYHIEVCKYSLTFVDYCNDKQLNNIISEAEKSTKIKYLGKYNVIIVDADDKVRNPMGERVQGIALVDTKAKLIKTIPFEFKKGSRVTYTRNEIKVYNPVFGGEHVGYGGGNETTPVFIRWNDRDSMFTADEK